MLKMSQQGAPNLALTRPNLRSTLSAFMMVNADDVASAIRWLPD
jgi:hypothetical protein